MASKLTLTVFAADGETIESTKEYSRKIDAENAGRKSGNAWTVANGKGAIVAEGAPSAKADPAPAKALHADVPVRALTDGKAKGKAAKAAPAKPKADAPKRAKVGTFDVSGKDGETHKCVGACGEKKPVKAFPTITGRPDVRVAECRSCRDTRTKAEKAARAAAK